MAKETITVRRHSISYLEMFEVTADELDRLQFEEPQNSHELSFALAALSFAVGLGIALATGWKNMGPKTFATFIGLAGLGFILFLVFVIRWTSNLKRREVLFRRIRERQIGPVGEEGTEIEPDQLAALPSDDATGTGSRTLDNAAKAEAPPHRGETGKQK
jgi:hypothetical protein